MSLKITQGQEDNDMYIIPPNFIDTGTIFGGTIKLRNALEALILGILIGYPVFQLPLTNCKDNYCLPYCTTGRSFCGNWYWW